jgi:HEAT repeat protein
MSFLEKVLGKKKTNTGKDISGLLKDLERDDIERGVCAAEALGKSQNPAAVLPLITALENKNYVASGNSAVAPVAEAAEKALIQLGPLAFDHVLPLLQRYDKPGDWHIRVRAARILGQIGDPRAAAPITHLLREQDSAVRTAAVKALSSIGKPAREALIEASKQENNLMKTGANEALALIGESPQGAETSLIDDLMKNSDLSIKKQAARALGNIGSKEGIDALISSLKEEDKDLRAYAMQSLVRIGPPAEEKVLAALNNIDRETMRNTRNALMDAIQFGELKKEPKTITIVKNAIKQSYGKEEIVSLLHMLTVLGDPSGVQLTTAAMANDTSTVNRILDGF